jgi:hypothetical protein
MAKSIIKISLLVAILLCYLGAQERACAIVIPIGLGDFSPSATLETYGTVQTGQPVDGQTFSGVLHHFTIGGVPSTAATIDGGAGGGSNVRKSSFERRWLADFQQQAECPERVDCVEKLLSRI